VKVGNPQVSPLQVRLSSRPSSVPTSGMVITPSGSLTDNANPLQRVLDLIWTTTRRDPASAVLPADRGTIRIHNALAGPEYDQYACILSQNMVPDAREIMSREFPTRKISWQPCHPSARYITAQTPPSVSTHSYSTTLNTLQATLGGTGARREGLHMRQSVSFLAQQTQHACVARNPNIQSRKYVVGRTANASKMAPLFMFRHGDPGLHGFQQSMLGHRQTHSRVPSQLLEPDQNEWMSLTGLRFLQQGPQWARWHNWEICRYIFWFKETKVVISWCS
jgi:hypothetical protein